MIAINSFVAYRTVVTVRFFRLLVLASIFLTTTECAFGQSARLIPVDDWTYVYIKRLQTRGYLLELNPTAIPYSEGEVVSALDQVDPSKINGTEKRWLDLLNTVYGARDQQRPHLSLEFDAGLSAAGSTRLDPLRPIRNGDSQIQAGNLHLYPRLFPRITLSSGRFVGQLGLHHNVYYDEDPDGLDAVTRLYVRSEESFAGYQGTFVSAYLGRFGQVWAPYGETSTLLSANARSFDQVYLRIGNENVSVRGILGELDSITGDGRYTGQAGADSVVTGSERRYLALHRFDWRPSRHVTFSAMESVLYSGVSTGVSLKYLNPFHALTFIVDERPKNEENNGLLAGMLWAQYGKCTFHGQLLIDDFDLMSQTGEPASIAAVSSLTVAGIKPELDAGIQMEMVTSRAYNTHQPEGRYLYLLRGIATQNSDYVRVSTFLHYYADRITPGLVVSPRLDLLLQGERNINQPYPTGEENVDLVLTGTEERIIRPAVEFYYQPVPYFWVRFNYGLNQISDFEHVAGDNKSELSGQLDFGLRFKLNTNL